MLNDFLLRSYENRPSRLCILQTDTFTILSPHLVECILCSSERVMSRSVKESLPVEGEQTTMRGTRQDQESPSSSPVSNAQPNSLISHLRRGEAYLLETRPRSESPPSSPTPAIRPNRRSLQNLQTILSRAQDIMASASDSQDDDDDDNNNAGAGHPAPTNNHHRLATSRTVRSDQRRRTRQSESGGSGRSPSQ